MYRPKYQLKAVGWMAMAAVAAFLSGGCAQGDEPSSAGENQVMFGACINDDAESRAFVADKSNLNKTGFGVFASSTGNGDFNPDAAAGFTPDFMYNQEVLWKAGSSGGVDDGTWHYQPSKIWPASKLSFFAYAPYAADFGATGITGFTGTDASGSPKISFKMDSDVDRHIDLLYSDAEKTLNLNKAGHVQFRFMHALSRIGFRRIVETALDAGTTVTITGVKLKLPSIGVAGMLNLYTGAWESLTMAEMEYTLDTDDFISGRNVINKSSAKITRELTTNGKYLMIIPSHRVVPVEVIVNYDVVTVDANLSAGSIKTSNEVAGEFDFNFETGKAYWFTLRLGLNSVKIGTSISDWEDSDTGWVPVEKPR
ncbi:MAG: fimbrillin family protein [Bacteroides sp.]|nr:fimbrillin family protein [Bacteroides sp.]MCM1389252.1 fimbrillin family protein [Bacteroides sp.]